MAPEYLSAEQIAETLRGEGDVHVTGRTVHYYAEQRLLPPPEYDGKRPRYTRLHLDAMRRVRALKRSGRRLEDIVELFGGAAGAPAAPVTAAREPAAHRYSPPSAGQRTIAVGPGLTLTASGWTDDEVSRIVAAIRAEVEALRGVKG